MTDPRVTHDADQMGAHLRLTARILGEYREELERAGFDRDAVVELCIEMQRLLTAESRPDGAK